MIKVIHCVDLNKFGGIKSLVLQMVVHQARENIKPAILLTKKLSKNFLTTIPADIKIYDPELLSGYDFSIKKFINILKIFSEFDIIHMHGFGILISLAAIFSKKKIVFTEHGTFQKANQFSSVKNFIKKRIFGYFFLNNFTDNVVFVSNWLKDNVALKTKTQCVIHNGILINKKKLLHSQNDLPYKILTVARLVKKKRLDRIFKAMNIINDPSKFFLLIVGDGPYRKNYEEMAELYLPKKNYKFFGYIENVDHFYKESSIFILSTENESFGLVVLEAIINGVIVLMFENSGGALEIIKDVDRRLIAKDEFDMAEKIKFWTNNKEERADILKLLYLRVQEEFNIDKMNLSYFEIYKQLHKNTK